MRKYLYLLASGVLFYSCASSKSTAVNKTTATTPAPVAKEVHKPFAPTQNTDAQVNDDRQVK